MRRTSFTEPVRFRPGLWAVAAWVVALALFGASGWALLEARKADAEADRLEAHGVRLGRELSEIGSSDVAVPTAEAFAELSGRIARLNALTGARQAALPVLLEALEDALPPGVWVGQMAYATETGVFTISLLGEAETDLPIALQRIEAIPRLTDVILERQVRVQTGTRNLLQYDIRAEAQ